VKIKVVFKRAIKHERVSVLNWARVNSRFSWAGYIKSGRLLSLAKVQQHESANRTRGLIRGCSGLAEMGVKNKARPAP
jgi:hypothetical protein